MEQDSVVISHDRTSYYWCQNVKKDSVDSSLLVCISLVFYVLVFYFFGIEFVEVSLKGTKIGSLDNETLFCFNGKSLIYYVGGSKSGQPPLKYGP